MFNSYEKNIIKNIILAQIASDAGKGYYDVANTSFPIIGKEVRKAKHFGYEIKDKYIRNAIELINTTPRCRVNYWCVKAPDQNGYDSIIAYFDIKGDKRYQISFHSPWDRTPLKGYLSHGRPTRWTKEVKGSIKACLELLKEIQS